MHRQFWGIIVVHPRERERERERVKTRSKNSQPNVADGNSDVVTTFQNLRYLTFQRLLSVSVGIDSPFLWSPSAQIVKYQRKKYYVLITKTGILFSVLNIACQFAPNAV
jgi:hypothetical protein